MLESTILRKLDKLGKRVNRYTDYRLNSGGCAVYASIVAKALRKHGINASGVVLMGNPNGSESIDRCRPENWQDVFEWEENGIFFNHVALEFAVSGVRYMYDSENLIQAPTTGEWFGDFGYVIDGRLTAQELHALASGDRGWNTVFDRSQIPTITKMVQKALQPGEALC